MVNKLFKIAYYLLLAGIAGIAILLIVSLFPIAGNYNVKIVLSGSMEPAIKTGSVVIIKPALDYQIGDIITFGKDTKKDIPTTHRIIETRTIEGKMLYTTKGDANNSKDVKEIYKKEIIGKMVFSIPFLGYLIDFVKKPIGFAFLIIIPASVIVYDEIKKIWSEVVKLKKKKRGKEDESVSSDGEDGKECPPSLDQKP